MSKIAFVMAMPSAGDSPEQGKELASRMGLFESDFFTLFSHVFLQPRFCVWGMSMPEAKASARNLRSLLDGRLIVLVGPQVAEAFEMGAVDCCRWMDHPSWDEFHGLFMVLPLPHDPERRSAFDAALGNILAVQQEEKCRALSKLVT